MSIGHGNSLRMCILSIGKVVSHGRCAFLDWHHLLDLENMRQTKTPNTEFQRLQSEVVRFIVEERNLSKWVVEHLLV
jgi:hypothetical protein